MGYTHSQYWEIIKARKGHTKRGYILSNDLDSQRKRKARKKANNHKKRFNK